MPISGSSVKRTPDASGDDIKTFDDAQGKKIQAAALVDENAAQVGTASNPMPVSATALPLPSGAATQTTLAALLTEMQAKTEPTDTQPVSAASLPLPSGAATETSLANVSAGTQAARFLPCDVEQASATVMYVGKEDKDGSWLIQKITVSGSATNISYATSLNNPSYIVYGNAWTDRASLTYQSYGSAF